MQLTRRFPSVVSVLLAAASSAAALASGDGGRSPLGAMRAEEVRANTYTFGAQEDPSVAVDEGGRILVVWSSRRQEGGGYGVFAQLLDPRGRPLGTELHVNRTVPGAQQDAYAVFAPDGSAWVVWCSAQGQGEGGEDAVVMRRLADTADGFGPAGDEVRVARATTGLLTDPTLAVGRDGEVLVAWVDNGIDGGRVRGRRLGPDGEPRGEGFFLGAPARGQERMPDVVALPGGGFFGVWQRADGEGIPQGIFGRHIAAEGAEGEELVVHDHAARWHVEPSIAVDAEGRLTVAWMATEIGAASYEVRARRFTSAGRPLGPSFVVEAGGSGPRNGAAVAAGPAGGFLVAYNVHRGWTLDEDGRGVERVEVRAALFDAEGAPRGAGQRLAGGEGGARALPVARNGRRAVWSAAGPLVVAWEGNTPGDEAGIGLTILTPPDLPVPDPAPIIPRAAAIDGSPARAEEDGTAPPDPLPGWRRALRPVPDRDRRSDGFVAHDQTGWTPPDPDLAVGGERIVSQANQETACFDKSGVQLWRRINTGTNGFWAGVGAETFVFDPIDVYDAHSDRFIIANSELASDGDYVVLAVSKDTTPDTVDDWWKYRVKVSPTCGFPDFPNLGVNRDYIYVTTDCFGGGGNRVIIFEKASVMNGTLGTWWNEQMSTGLQSLGNTKNYDTTNAFQYFVSGSTSKQLRIQCKRSPTAAPDYVTLTVDGWGPPRGAPQLGSSNLLSTIDARIKNGVVRNGRLYAAHGVGYQGVVTTVKWYEVDLRGWPTSGNLPVVLQDARLDLGPGVFSWFPDIHADAAGNITVAYNRSAANELPSIEACFRRVGDAPGTMRPPKRLKTSSSSYSGSRYGDYSGVDEDPAQPGRYWSHAEYSRGPWETWIGYWDIDDQPDPYAQFTAAPTEGDEDLLVTFTDWSRGTGLTGWAWSFGDSTGSSLQNPTHLYEDPGTYTVSLLVSGANGYDLRTKTDLVVVVNVPEASATVRNGSGVNPLVFSSTSLPYLGTTWTSEIDGGAIGASGLTFVAGYAEPLSGVFLAYGELLLDPTSAWIVTDFSTGGGGISHHAIGIPNDPSLAGFQFSTQAFLNQVSGFSTGRLANAIDLELSY